MSCRTPGLIAHLSFAARAAAKTYVSAVLPNRARLQGMSPNSSTEVTIVLLPREKQASGRLATLARTSSLPFGHAGPTTFDTGGGIGSVLERIHLSTVPRRSPHQCALVPSWRTHIGLDRTHLRNWACSLDISTGLLTQVNVLLGCGIFLNHVTWDFLCLLTHISLPVPRAAELDKVGETTVVGDDVLHPDC